MTKIKAGYIKNQYENSVHNYANFTKEVGVWDSEKYVFEKYLNPSYRILDLGCGTGRTTFPLFKMGFENIIGVDLTPKMIETATGLNEYFDTKIQFRIGDATALKFEDNSFDCVLFSFNGLMTIPGEKNREKAIREINRVLKSNGFFIFTTHDRDGDVQFLQYWKDEAIRWENGLQNPRLYEFGDRIAQSKNEEREIFIHIPNQREVVELMTKNGLEVVDTFYRNELFDESELVKKRSGECRFWITKKIS